MSSPPTFDLQALLREQEWARRLAARLVGEGPDADDLTQEALVRALRHPGARGEVRSARGWLGAILRNLSRERTRADARRRAREVAAAVPEAHDEADALRRAELRRELLDLVLHLPEPERTTVVLHFLEELPYADVAARTGVSVAAARQRVSRALRRLRARLDARDALPALAGLLRPAGPPLAVPTPAPSVAGPLSTLLLMTAKTKLFVGAAGAALLALLAARALQPGDPSAPGPSPAAAVASVAPAAERSGVGAAARADEPEALAPASQRRAEAAANEPATHVFVGRVVGAGRYPVEGATLSLPHGAEDGGSTRSDADGRFRLAARLPIPPPGETSPPPALWARDEAGRSAWSFPDVRRLADAPQETVDVGTLTLLPSFTLTVHVDAGEPTEAEVDVALALGHARRPAGSFRVRPAEALTLRGLPRGVVHVGARTPGRAGRAQAFVPEEDELELRLRPTHAVEVLVVDAETGAPVPGATVRVTEHVPVPAEVGFARDGLILGEYVTERSDPDLLETAGRDGRAAVGGLEPDVDYAVRAEAEGYAPSDRQSLREASPPVRLALRPAPPRTVRWEVTDADGPVPPDGSPVTLRPLPGSSWGPGAPRERAARVEGGELVLDGLAGRLAAHAVAPDGAIARVFVAADDSVGRAITFGPARRVTIDVQDAEGAPVAGARVRLRDQGNMPVSAPVPTGADGRAVLSGLHGDLVDVRVVPPDAPDRAPVHGGSVDLRKGDARLTVRLADDARRARLRLRVEGERRLPDRLQVGSLHDVELVAEDPDEAELTLVVRGVGPGHRVKAWLQAEGYRTETALLHFQGEDDVPVVELELAPAGRLVVVPEQRAAERLELWLERLDEASGAWTQEYASTGGGLSRPNGPDGTYRFEGLELGRWRARDYTTGAATEPLVLTATEPSGRLALDLTTSAWASGTVRVDDASELARVRVFVTALDAPAPTQPPREPGALRSGPSPGLLTSDRFRVRVPVDAEVRVVAWHPWLVPDAESRDVRVRGARDDLHLRLVPGDELRLPAPQLEPSAAPRIARFPAGAGTNGEPLAWHQAPLVDGVVRCGLPAGSWDLLVDAGDPWAPLELARVDVQGSTLLDAAVFPAGSTLRIEVETAEGRDPPRLFVFATRVGPLELLRSRNTRGERTPELPGLGPGTWRIEVGPVMNPARSTTTTVEVDGVHPVTLSYDAR